MKCLMKRSLSIWVAQSKPYSDIPKKCVKIMVNNIHKMRTNYTNFTYIIKVSNSSKNNSLSCISKNEGNEKK